MDLGQALTTGSVALISLYVGLVGATAQQDRTLLLRQRGVARTLLKDLERISCDLQQMHELAQLGLIQSVQPLVPTIHPWIKGLISDVADADPEIFGAFMQLQKALRQNAQSAKAALKTANAMLRAAAAHEDAETQWHLAGAVGYVESPRGMSAREANAPVSILPDTEQELEQWIEDPHLPTASLARAKLEWVRWRDARDRTLSVLRIRPNQSLRVIEELRRRLTPIAEQRIPSVLGLALREIGSVPEDGQLDDLRRGRSDRNGRQR